MQKIFFITSLFIITAAQAQVIIGDAAGMPGAKTGVLLEFANSNNKGIILPYVITLPASPTPGTIVLDASNPTEARVKYYNGAWVDLSGINGDVSPELADQPATPATTNADSKAIIGATATIPAGVEGVLVLQSNTKAMVLPQVDNVNKIIDPAAGMMVYVNLQGSKRLAVFNGTKWSFWKP